MMPLNNDNRFKVWEPLPGTLGKLLVEQLTDTDEGLTIHLRFTKNAEKQDKRIKIQFDPYVAYRNMDESYRANTFNKVGGFENSFYTVSSSSWLRWLHEESLGFYEDAQIVHYTIITEADCVDILSEFAPTVNWVP